MFDLREIVVMCREKGCEKFERYAEFTNTDEGKYMITFMQKTESCRKVNDWGREEDKDIVIGLDKEGWIVYYQTNQNCAGEFKILKEHTERTTDDYIMNYLQGEECTNANYLQFMKNAYEVCNLWW